MSTATRATAYADTAERHNDAAGLGRTGRNAAADVSSYVADMCSGLIDMARAAELDVLSYILGMARLEAEMQNRKAATGERVATPRRRKRRTPPPAASPAISPAS